LHELEPQSPAYNLTANIRLNLALNIPVLQASLNTLIERHEVLRTSFVVVDDLDGLPKQVITPSLTLPLPLVDLSALSEPQRQVETLQLANQEAKQPFDLGQAPLLRVRLLKLAEQDFLLLVTFHHIISDGWSINVFFQELAALYNAFAQGQPSPLPPPPPLQYIDFAIWQQEYIKRNELSEQLAYWKQQLAGAPTTLDLPTDHPRSISHNSRGSHYLMTLPTELSDALKTLSRQQGVTLYMTLVAAFQCLLFRYSSQDDLILGTVASGRTLAGTESLLGFFVNTLVLRTDLSGNPTFSELLGRVREVVLQAHAH
jgi:Condensation domain